jgi:hypothetical protein
MAGGTVCDHVGAQTSLSSRHLGGDEDVSALGRRPSISRGRSAKSASGCQCESSGPSTPGGAFRRCQTNHQFKHRIRGEPLDARELFSDEVFESIEAIAEAFESLEVDNGYCSIDEYVQKVCEESPSSCPVSENFVSPC